MSSPPPPAPPWPRKAGDPEYGARPLKRAIQRRLENRLAEAILANQLLPGDTAVIDFGEDGWKLEPRRASAAAETAAAR